MVRKFAVRILVGFLAIIVIGIIMLAVPIFSTSRPHWPKIEDGQTLLTDCAVLIEKYGGANIPIERWPRSIQVLKPSGVLTQSHMNYVEIIISGGGIDGAWGFVVLPDKRSVSPQDLHLTEMRIFEPIQEGIFRFETLD